MYLMSDPLVSTAFIEMSGYCHLPGISPSAGGAGNGEV